MRKKIAVWMILNFFLATLIAASSIGSVKASISSWGWDRPQISDPIHGTVYAFKENSTATLYVSVSWFSSNPLNVSAVKVGFDWKENFSSTEASKTNPLVIPPSAWTTQYYTFTINVSVPLTTTASNLFRHHYWIYVEQVNATTGPQKVTTHAVASGSNFVVYSASQSDAQTLRQEIDRIFTQYPSVSSAAAQILRKSAMEERNAGEESYKAMDFVSAKTHYQATLTLLDQMVTAEESYLTRDQVADLEEKEADTDYKEAQVKREEAYANSSITQANALMKQADAAMIEANATMRMADAAWLQADAARLQGYSMNLFAIGFILFGVAAIIYASKKPRPPP